MQDVNIKKKSASHIYFGVNKETGKLMHISQVSSGAKCNCKCGLCGEDLEARKGEQRIHHFAHVSNYECMYAGEIAIYLAFANSLSQLKQIRVPANKLQTPGCKNPKILKDARTIEIDRIDYECNELAYPPMLMASSRGNNLRILLNFGNYYDDSDMFNLANEAEKDGYSILMYQMPKIYESTFFTADFFAQIISNGARAYWGYSRLEEYWREKIRQENQACFERLKLEAEARRKKAEALQEKIRLAEEASKEENQQAEYQRIKESFDPNAPEWTIDKYGQRWIQCKVCGEIKRDYEMASYGGPDGANLGLCATCSRKDVV